MTTSASHGRGGSLACLAGPPGSRSQGSVRRFSAICGSRLPKSPSAIAGGKVERIWSGGIMNRGALTVTSDTCSAIGSSVIGWVPCSW